MVGKHFDQAPYLLRDAIEPMPGGLALAAEPGFDPGKAAATSLPAACCSSAASRCSIPFNTATNIPPFPGVEPSAIEFATLPSRRSRSRRAPDAHLEAA